MGIRERWLSGVSTISLVSLVWGVCTCRIHNGLRAPFTQEYVPHSLRHTGPIHTGVRAPFTHTCTFPLHTCVPTPFTQADFPHSHFSAHCPIHTRWPSSWEPVHLNPWKFTGKLRSRPPLSRLAGAIPRPPRLASTRPAPPLATLALLLHPSLCSPVLPTIVVLIPLSRVCTGSFVYVLLLLSCAVNVHSFAVLRVVSRAYQPCMQGSSQMVRSTRSTARRGASNKDPPSQVRKQN